jgi:hypothetical protein
MELEKLEDVVQSLQELDATEDGREMLASASMAITPN